jgi:hypothetical protein
MKTDLSIYPVRRTSGDLQATDWTYMGRERENEARGSSISCTNQYLNPKVYIF